MSSFANEMVECCICMECISTTNKTTTECGHTFHSSCIFKNLSQRVECPMCRKELVELPEEETLYDSEEDDDSDDDSDENDIKRPNSSPFTNSETRCAR